MKKFWFCAISLLLSAGMQTFAQEDRKTDLPLVQNQAETTFSHTVERGETVYAIATMYGVSKEDIYRLNPESRKRIKVGETLRIPQRKNQPAQEASQSADTESFLFHTIEAGETLYAVSMRHKVSAMDIVEANPGLSTTTFRVGRTIRIPKANRLKEDEKQPKTEQKTVVKEEEYKIQRKETMYSLCRKFNISSHELIKRNPSLKKGVKAGKIIYIPVTTTEEVVIKDLEHEASLSESEVNALLNQAGQIKPVNQLRVALLLPFMTQQPTASTPRFVEYYEGLLLAADSLRNLGA